MRVAAVLVEDDQFILVRHRVGSHAYHLLPGGGVEAGETLATALVREVEEETGLHVRVVRPILVSDTLDPAGVRHLVNISFLVERTGGELATRPRDPRVEAVDLVPAAALRTLDLRPPMADALLEAFEHDFAEPARYLGALWVDDAE